MKTLSLALVILFFLPSAMAEWKIDFSRRQQDLIELEKQQTTYKEEQKTILDMVTDRQAPLQDLVIINTHSGFYPQNVQVRKNQRYRIHVVNVNKDNKNVSFMMDAFSQHHGTYFGEEVTFVIEPRREGMFDFQCPETAAKGHFVVFASDSPVDSPLENIKLRAPASE
ncbi:MAG: cupredoxin domain-containing protein [Bdellovibrionales bacterium]|nr:cupredoxin domain-containing protein [Bdellovibrionales bacterium]